MRIWMDFGSLLERFWSDFGPKLGAKLGAKFGPTSIKHGSKLRSKIECDLGWVLEDSWERSWNDFGPKLGAKLKPKWNQNPLKVDVENKMGKESKKIAKIWQDEGKMGARGAKIKRSNSSTKVTCHRRLGSGEYEGNPQGYWKIL